MPTEQQSAALDFANNPEDDSIGDPPTEDPADPNRPHESRHYLRGKASDSPRLEELPAVRVDRPQLRIPGLDPHRLPLSQLVPTVRSRDRDMITDR